MTICQVRGLLWALPLLFLSCSPYSQFVPYPTRPDMKGMTIYFHNSLSSTPYLPVRMLPITLCEEEVVGMELECTFEWNGHPPTYTYMPSGGHSAVSLTQETLENPNKLNTWYNWREQWTREVRKRERRICKTSERLKFYDGRRSDKESTKRPP